MYILVATAAFRKGVKRCEKKHWNMEVLKKALKVLENSDAEEIPASYKDHALKGNLKEYREIHLGSKNSNWLLIYGIEGNEIFLIATGTHDDLL